MKVMLYRLVVLFLLCCFSVSLKAAEFTLFPKAIFQVDSVLTPYDTTIVLGNANTEYSYDVSIEYPEYEELTKAEVAVVKRYGHTLGTTVQVSQQVVVERKVASLEVRVIPFIYKNNKYYRLVSAKVAVRRNAKRTLARQTLNTVTATRYASHSVLAQGKWVKIRVGASGIYQINANTLTALGFQLDKVKVYGYGGRMQDSVMNYSGNNPNYDDLEEVPVYRRSGSLLFYAQGPVSWSSWAYNSTLGMYFSNRVVNPYSSYGYYFITEGTPTAMSELTATVSPQSTLTTFPERVLYEKDDFAWLESGRGLFDSFDFAQTGTKSYTLATPDAMSEKAAVYVCMSAANGSGYTQISVSLDGNDLGRISIAPLSEYYAAKVGASTFTSSATLGSTSRINVVSPIGVSARLDFISMLYTRRLRMAESSLVFSHYETGARKFEISGANSHTQLWRLGRANDPTALVTATLDGDVLSAEVDDATRDYVAVDVSATYPTPVVVGVIDNQDLHAHTAADMIIIIPESGKLLEQAQRLAALHEKHDSLRVRIVKANEIYNEFSSGTPDAMAYRRYLKMLYDRAETSADMPRYLLLFGSSVWDNRMLSSGVNRLDSRDYLLCYESDNAVHRVLSYVSDDFFGLLDDNEGVLSYGKLDVGIGRINPTTAEEAKIIVDKIADYMENKQTGAWKNLICMMGDDGDNNLHMSDANKIASQIESQNGSYQVKKVFWDAYTRQSSPAGNRYPDVTALLENTMSNGALVMNYTGHGSPTLISHEQVLNISHFKKGTNNRSPFWAFAACEVTPFDGLSEYISAAALFNTKGAAIATYGASRDVYASDNYALNRQMMNYLLKQDDSGSYMALGDVMRLAKNALGATTNDNKAKYILLGDPALKLKAPSQKIVVDSVNGQAADGTTFQLKAGSLLTIKGHVENFASGATLTAFNGAVTATMFDRSETVTCKKNDSSTSAAFTFQSRGGALFEGSDSISNGEFVLTIPVPLDISYGTEKGKMYLYAVNSDKTVEAHGAWSDYYLNGSELSDNDSIGPKIFAYLNTPNFIDGGLVGSTPYFVATISDEDGINTTGMGVGHDIELIIDNNASSTYILNDYFSYDFGTYTSGQVTYTIPALSVGKHQLKIRAWDLKNNSSTAVLNFVVGDNANVPLSVSLSRSLTNSSTQFIIYHNQVDVDAKAVIQVYDIVGRLYKTVQLDDNASSGLILYDFDLTSATNRKLPAGVYLCKVALETASTSETATVKLIITD